MMNYKINNKKLKNQKDKIMNKIKNKMKNYKINNKKLKNQKE